MFHVEHFPNFLFLMALDIVQYKSGDPITAGLTYQIPGEINSDAWILQSTTQGAVFQMTGTAPTDEDWSNIQGDQFHINGTVTGLVLPILAYGYFRVVKEPVTEHATMALVEQEFIREIADPINPFVAGTPVAPGYYDLSSLNLEAGKMYVLSVLPVQDKDYPETPGIVTDETFSAVIVGLTGTKATQVILRGVTTVGSHLFVMTGAKPILHLGGRSNVKFNITVSPVVFSAGGGEFDPSQPATITGLWDLQNVSSINMVDEGPIILGKGENAVKIHGSGTGSAVIEGANGATLDIAVPVDFSEPITFQDTISYNRVGSTGEPIFQRWVMPRNTLVLKGYEAVGSFGFANADGSQNYIGIDTNGNVSFLKNTSHSGASTFSAGVTMGQTLTVAGVTTLNNNLVLNSSNGGPTISASGGTVSWTQLGNPLRFQIQDTNASIIFSGSASTANVDIQKPDAQTLTATSLMNKGECDAYYIQKDETITLNNLNVNAALKANNTLAVAGASTFTGGVTMAQTLTVTGRATMNGGIILPNKDLFLGPSTRFIAETGNNLELRIDAPDGSFTVPYLTTKASAGTSSGNLEVGGAANVQGNLTVTLDAALNRNILMGPVTISRSANMLTFSSPVTFQGAMTFNAGVTMAQSLNCSSTLQVASHFYVGDSIQTNTDLGKFTSAALTFKNTVDSTEDLQLVTDAGGVYIRITRENFYMGSADPDPTDVLSVKEMDARYAKIVTTTKAAYTALATKDPTTIYLITDTTPRMWAIGDMEIVTADVPA